MQINADPHPLLAATAFTTVFPRPLAEMPSPASLLAFLTSSATAPVSADDALRGSTRALLRHGGFKPSGRAKPASEYLVRAIGEGALSPINLAVDACNVVSYHSGFPISVVDLDRAHAPFRLGVAGEGDRYIFNASGQEMDLAGLLCLYDAEGPSANAVKDSQRTKTHDATTRTLSVLWVHKDHAAQGAAATRWYRDLLEASGATTEDVEIASATR